MKIALYPGSFDPVTNGHLDTALRATRLVDTLVIGVFDRPLRNLLFSTAERVALIEAAVADYPSIRVMPYNSLTVEFAASIGADLIVRGLRDSMDFERELQTAQVNQTLAPDIDMVLFMASHKYTFLSASTVREIASLGGSVDAFVPAHVADALQRKFASTA